MSGNLAVNGEDSNGFTGLDAKLALLQRASAALSERAEVVARRMRSNAGVSIRLADLCEAAEAGPQHVAAAAEIAAAFGRTVGGAVRLVGVADRMNSTAAGARSAHNAEYGGMHAAATSMARFGARQAKPAFYMD